ncbi:MAG: phosphoribosylanthranilate isomerase [Parabacteroides sp.]|nr:phosphoribosylanthranilate isomerase [Parabacteroides sp.]MCI7009576.1 phosphoribosylanthranilate isomerase [Parabacteroides sp.]MCI7784035.1 phosphoribosylanthranilate isomerase [Parabacteroides sp.]
MITKVCGLCQAENIQAVAKTGIQWTGFIFYTPSPRCLLRDPAEAERVRQLITADAFRPKRVGVFVNASQEEIMEVAQQYRLDYLQLHGHESPDFCYALQKRGYALIKAFSIATAEDLAHTADYAGRVDYFLFDTKCAGYGGSGQRFDWSLLQDYQGETPFLLSGGVRPEMAADLQRFHHPRWAGIDLNSGFESAPGVKQAETLRSFQNNFKL